MGTSPLDAPIQDGTTSGEWDTSQGLASAIGGQDMHALQFTGAEVQPAISGSAVALEQGGGGSGVWASHPSAIGYRRQGYTTGGSHGGSGSMTVTIAAVAPEFDSGMNAGTGQDEVERLGNFGQGAEENPTVAQSQPTSRGQQQVNRTSAGAGGPSMNGIMDPSNDNPPWRAGANPYSGHGYYNPFVGWFGWGGGAPDAGGGVSGSGRPNRSSPYSSALTPPAARPTLPQKRPPLWDDPNHIPGPGKYSTANEPDQPDTGAATGNAANGAGTTQQPVARARLPSVLPGFWLRDDSRARLSDIDARRAGLHTWLGPGSAAVASPAGGALGSYARWRSS